tara:strand:- start:7307 stop:7645 length:339 start_codon:yes stop_codon:yes gene_type:complete
MALNRTKLTDVVRVASGSTVGIATVSSNKKVFVKSILAFNNAGTASTAQVYFVPNGGSAGESTRIFNITLTASESTILEPSYPFVLESTGDEIKVGAMGSAINFIVTGDREV